MERRTTPVEEKLRFDLDKRTWHPSLSAQPALVFPERLEGTKVYGWHLPDGTTLAIPVGWGSGWSPLNMQGSNISLILSRGTVPDGGLPLRTEAKPAYGAHSSIARYAAQALGLTRMVRDENRDFLRASESIPPP